MASNRQNILSGLNKDAHREAVGSLIDQGWSASKTGGGHIKLVHPLASRPVFTASTPSCRYSHKRLIADAQRSLKGTATMVSSPRPDDFREAIGQAIPMRSEEPAVGGKGIPMPGRPGYAASTAAGRKKRWSKEEKEERDLKVSALMAQMRDEDKATRPEKAKAKPVKERPMKKERLAMNNTPSKVCEKQIVETPLTLAPATGPLPIGTEIIDPDHLALALDILAGKFRSLTITADMVGSTLIVARDAFVTQMEGVPVLQATALAPSPAPLAALPDAAAPVATATLQPEPVAPAANLPGSPSSQRLEVLEALAGFGKPVSCAEVARAIHAGAHGDMTASQMECVRHQLRKLVRSGAAVESREGRSMLYMAAGQVAA